MVHLEFLDGPLDLEDEALAQSCVNVARDKAHALGFDEYRVDGDVEIGASKFRSRYLRQDYRDGWYTAAARSR